MNKSNLEIECNKYCNYHGEPITSAITKWSISDQALGSFMKATCANFLQATDFQGRTALHMAASRGRQQLVDWLARHAKESLLNAKDNESGYTALHRAIFYGQIHVAVTLMKCALVHSDVVDKDDYRALQHALLDRHYMFDTPSPKRWPCDAYVWGSNSNYTLGTGAQRHKESPDVLGCFTNSQVLQVCLGKFHSVWLCSTAEGPAVFACGQLARAGAPVSTVVKPVQLRLAEPVAMVTLMLNSTVFLMQSGAVVQYSLNSTDTSISQSKTPSNIKLPSVKPLIKLSDPTGVCSSKHHAVVWNKRAIYTWGVNVGQLGQQADVKFVEAPKRVMLALNTKEEITLELAAAADASTVLSTSRGDVYLLHKYLCKKIAVKQINLREISVDSKVNEQGSLTRVTVLLLTNLGQLHIWQDTSNRLTRCVFGLAHQTTITQVTLTHDAMYFTTKYGEAYVGHISRKSPSSVPLTAPRKDKDRDNGKSALVKFLEKDDCTSVRLTRIPNIHRGVSIVVDGEGINFACLQSKPRCGLKSLPALSPSSSSKLMSSLLETCSENDLLTDVIFKIGQKLYPAHMFIIASGSEHLLKLYMDQKLESPDEVPTIAIENVLPEVFERILRYLYTGSCDVTQPGPCDLKIKKEDINKGAKEKEHAEIDTELIENAAEISAFEANKKLNDKGVSRKMRKQRSNETPPKTSMYCDPVRLLQAAAKRLHVMGLHKALERFYCRDSTIFVRDSATYVHASPLWSRESFPELIDTNVSTKDGHRISAHKCVLAAKLEYFHGMFMHTWSESKTMSTVTLPINHSILLPVINFLYSDTCPEIESSDNIDFICNILVVADQLFINRLREMCEVALANLVTLKNCAELCQFAHTYNAEQLKQCCMEFISLNICTILENRSLEMLDDKLLEDISKYYCKFNPIMSSRVITPFFNAPSDDSIEECLKNAPIDLELTDDNLKMDDAADKKRRSKKSEHTENERARKRYESVSSVNSLDLSLDTSGDITLSLSNIAKTPDKETKESPAKWTKVTTTQHKVQARLKAISSAKEILKESPVESFVTLTKSASSPVDVTSPQLSSRMSVSPKDSTFAELARSPPNNIVISHIGPKLSQKQRKKLAQQGDCSQSLDEFLSNKLVLESPPKRNPWKIIEAPSTSNGPAVVKAPQFNQILADQRKLKDDSDRIMTKPLAMTQLEDKAIEELERFYSIHDVDDELISVQRIALQVAAPKWINTLPNML